MQWKTPLDFWFIFTFMENYTGHLTECLQKGQLCMVVCKKCRSIFEVLLLSCTVPKEITVPFIYSLHLTPSVLHFKCIVLLQLLNWHCRAVWWWLFTACYICSEWFVITTFSLSWLQLITIQSSHWHIMKTLLTEWFCAVCITFYWHYRQLCAKCTWCIQN